MDNRKIRCIKREIKVKKLSQQAAAYRQNFRTEQRKPEEETPEHYAERNIAGYGRKYANTVKAQGQKLLVQQKEKEWQRKKFREQGAQAESLSSSEGTLRQPAEKRAGMQKNGRTTTSSIKQRQNLQARRKKQAHISSVLREKGYSDRESMPCRSSAAS